jgi:uncharacterized membrane protein YqaE (UPF0057 family)
MCESWFTSVVISLLLPPVARALAGFFLANVLEFVFVLLPGRLFLCFSELPRVASD